MRKRLRRTVMVAVAAALAVFVVPLGLGMTALLDARAGRDAERAALEAAFRIGPGFTSGDPVELPRSVAAAVGLYGPDGIKVGGVGPARLDAAVRGARSGSIVQAHVDGAVVAAVPVTANETVIGVVRASAAAGLAAEIAGVWAVLLGVAAVIMLGASLAARRAARQLADPVERVAAMARSMGSGSPPAAPAASGIEEVDAVSAALADAGTRIAHLVEREQRIASDASHQLRTPLAGLRARLEVGLASGKAGSAGLLAEALEQVDRMDATIDGFLALARRPPMPAAHDVPADVIAERAARWRDRLPEGRRLLVRVEDDVAGVPMPILAVGIVLDVLLENAVRHGAGDVEVVLRRVGGVVALDVIDAGPYRGPEDPFPDGVSADGGSGIGLGLAARAAADFGARLLLAETVPRTQFSLLVPLVAPVAADA